MRFVMLSVSLLVLSAASAVASASIELVASGLNRPIYATAPAGDDRLFIVEQRGRVFVLEADTVNADPFLNIDSLVVNVNSFSEQGLLGMEFAPDYDSTGYFYVHYSNLSGNTVIARYTVDAGNPNKADHSSAEIVLTATQPFANHNGGSIAFGPDGYLYIGLGDGGSGGDPGNRAQTLTTLLGKILRIDVSTLPYTIPLDNPFVGDSTALDEIWDYGLRNPYRFSFDRLTGDLWIADVGQETFEEVDVEAYPSTGKRNYGWRLMEGFSCYNPGANCGSDTLDLPVYVYNHGAGCSITGGYVYRGTDVPELYGKYLFGDFCSGFVRAITIDTDTTVEALTSQLNPNFPNNIGSLASFAEDGFGEMYIIDRASTNSGEVYKIVQDPTTVGDTEDSRSVLRLGRPAPNPTTGSTQLRLFLDRRADVLATVHDIAGRRIRTLTHEVRGAGESLLEWDGRDESGARVASGVYFIGAKVDGQEFKQRVTLVR